MCACVCAHACGCVCVFSVSHTFFPMLYIFLNFYIFYSIRFVVTSTMDRVSESECINSINT